jgi:hypothetical protein
MMPCIQKKKKLLVGCLFLVNLLFLLVRRFTLSDSTTTKHSLAHSQQRSSLHIGGARRMDDFKAAELLLVLLGK